MESCPAVYNDVDGGDPTTLDGNAATRLHVLEIVCETLPQLTLQSYVIFRKLVEPPSQILVPTTAVDHWTFALL